MGDEVNIPYWKQCLQSVREEITGSKYIWESYYNSLDPKIKQFYCQSVHIDYCHPNGKSKVWAELTEDERWKVGRFYFWWNNHYKKQVPQGLSMDDFLRVTTNE